MSQRLNTTTFCRFTRIFAVGQLVEFPILVLAIPSFFDEKCTCLAGEMTFGWPGNVRSGLKGGLFRGDSVSQGGSSYLISVSLFTKR